MGGVLGVNIGKSIVGGADVKNKILKLLIAVAVAGIIFTFVCLFMTLNPKFDFQESYDGKLRLFKLADTRGRTNLLIVRESTGDHISYAIPFTPVSYTHLLRGAPMNGGLAAALDIHSRRRYTAHKAARCV